MRDVRCTTTEEHHMVLENTRKKLWHKRHSSPEESTPHAHLSSAAGTESSAPSGERYDLELVFEQGRVAGRLGAELEAVREDVDRAREAAREAREYAESKAGSHFSLWKKVSGRVGAVESSVGSLRSSIEALQSSVGTLEAGALAVERRFLESEKAVARVDEHLQDLQKKWHEETVARLAAVLPMMPGQSDYSALLGSVSLKEVLGRIEDPLFVHELAETQDGYRHLNLTALRGLARDLYRMGYLQRSHRVMRRVASSSTKPNDEAVVAVRLSEIEVMSGSFLPESPAVDGTSFAARPARVLHVVGKAIPETQTGYTLRTHYLAQALSEEGYEVGVFRQSGGVREPHDAEFVRLDGIDYFLPHGQVRGDIPWTEWLDENVAALADVVSRYQPSGLHAHSDFLNFLIAKPVGDAFGIPVVYESRGFWEESWLSRAEDAQGQSLEPQIARYGMPETYSWRREREDHARGNAAVVTTLARVMRDHIEQRGLSAEGVYVTPNGVDPEDFPVVPVDRELKSELGIAEEKTVIGYITSVVEYEGIDVLLEAFESLAKARSDIHLLIVGDGQVKRRLETYSEQLGISDRVIFTGRVPHEEVLRYYSLIDIFVIPRRPTMVCQLVTPLKPFEAFSTGRTVVMSDVRALKEIADDSQAALTFEAGNPIDLSKVLNQLLDDEVLRRELAGRGAEWVRAERSWSSIARLYEAPYRKVGLRVQTPLSEWDPFSEQVIDGRVIRTALRTGSKPEALRFLHMHSDDLREDHVAAADEIMSSGWAGHGFPAVDLAMPVEWRALGGEDRSWQMHVHSWEFMESVLEAWNATGDDRYLTWCIERAVSWGQEFQDIDEDSMAWYDMALAYRSVSLLSLIRAGAISTAVSDENFIALLRLALRQRDAHWRESSFNPRNNHGYYAAVSQLVLGRELEVLPGMELLARQGRRRLRIMTDGQFLPDGGHSEHSPDYHRMLLGSFEGAIRCGAIDDDDVKQVIERAADNLGWMVQPNGYLVQFGDSPEREMVHEARSSISPTTDWIVSGGARGKPTEQELKVLPETGYAFVRSPAAGPDVPFSDTSYLALACGFHSRTHKHADDQTVVWFDRGREILVDAGRYRYGALLEMDSPLRRQGFYYADPMRQYMESCRAHSTVSLDGDMHDRRRQPYGSGLREAIRREDGTFDIASTVPHGHWSHERRLEFRPGQELVVSDVVDVGDADPHTFYTWFLLDGHLDVHVTDEGDLHVRADGWQDMLVVSHDSPEAELSVVRGQEDPIRGFRSRKDRTTEPAWSVCWAAPVEGSATARTRFAFVPQPETTTPSEDGTTGHVEGVRHAS